MKKYVNAIRERLTGQVPLLKRRSTHWRTVRDHFLMSKPTCAVCGSATKLQVHHVIPFHIDRSKELDVSNLITLCESGKPGFNCHLHVGHNDNFRSYNPNVRKDAAKLLKALTK
jgi:hypothetical protein